MSEMKECESMELPVNGGTIVLNVCGLKTLFHVATLGDLDFTAFTKDELAEFKPGWYMMDGSFYANDTEQAMQLNALPEGYKERMGIVNDGEQTSIPNFFYEDGRGMFVRAGKTVGTIQGDAIRNITGSFNPGVHSTGRIAGEGAFYLKPIQQGVENSTVPGQYAVFDASRVVPTAEENRPLNIALTPIIYLGV